MRRDWEFLFLDPLILIALLLLWGPFVWGLKAFSQGHGARGTLVLCAWALAYGFGLWRVHRKGYLHVVASITVSLVVVSVLMFSFGFFG